MTCIAGIESRNHVYIGGDSAAISGTALCVRADPKVFLNSEFLIGFTSSYRMGQLLRFSFKPPVHPHGMDDFEYLVNLFVDGVRCCLQLGGFAKRKEEQESAGAFLVGYRGGLYTIDSDYQVARAIDGIAAIGSGAQVAIGALSAMIAASERGVRESDRSISAGCECKDPIDRVNRDLSTRQKPEQILLTALAAAERWNSTVRRPFTVISDRERLNNPSIDISNRSRKIAQ